MSSLEQRKADLAKDQERVDRILKENRYGIADLFEGCMDVRHDAFDFSDKPDIVEWAEANIYLPEGVSDDPGLFVAEEFQKEFLRLAVDSMTQRLVIEKSVQIGYSLLSVIVILYTITVLGKPVAYVTHNDEELKSWLKKYYNPFWKKEAGNEVLWPLLRPRNQDEDKDTLAQRMYANGVTVYFRSAGSDDAGRGFRAWLVLIDEADANTFVGINKGSGKQGDFIEILQGRMTRYTGSGRLVIGGSPTDEEQSNIHRKHGNTDKREWFVPCPFCSGAITLDKEDPADRTKWTFVSSPDEVEPAGYQPIRFGDNESTYGYKFELDQSNHAVLQVPYLCEFNEHHYIPEIDVRGYKWRAWQDRKGQWRPTAEGGEWKRGKRAVDWDQIRERINEDTGEKEIIRSHVKPRYIGLHMWAGMNKSVPRNDTVSQFLEAKRGGPSDLQTFENNQLGKPFRKHYAYREITAEQLAGKTVNYPAHVPDDVFVLVAGVDAQTGGAKANARLEVSIYGFDRFGTRYLIGHFVIEGMPYGPESNRALDKLLDRPFYNRNGHPFVVAASCHDVGNDPGDRGAKYCQARTLAGKLRFAVRGLPDQSGKEQKTLVNRPAPEKASTTRFAVYWVDTLKAKNKLNEALQKGHDFGGIFFPWSARHVDLFFEGLTCEEKRIYKTGFKWMPTGSLSGEPLDCAVYAHVAFVLLQQTSLVWAHIDEIADKLGCPLELSLKGDPYSSEGDKSIQAANVRTQQSVVTTPMAPEGMPSIEAMAASLFAKKAIQDPHQMGAPAQAPRAAPRPAMGSKARPFGGRPSSGRSRY